MFSMCMHLLLEKDANVLMGFCFFIYKISSIMIICSSFSFLMVEKKNSYDICSFICTYELQTGVLMVFWEVLIHELFSYMLNHIVQFH
jgi:hypothetical protein